MGSTILGATMSATLETFKGFSLFGTDESLVCPFTNNDVIEAHWLWKARTPSYEDPSYGPV